MSNRRIRSIDVLRGAIIVLMITVHFWEYFITQPADYWGMRFHRWLIYPWGAMVAPFFVLISGTSTWLGYTSRIRKGDSWEGVAIRNFKRGLALFLFAVLVRALMLTVLPDPRGNGILNWGVIQLIGICVCLIPFYGHTRWPYRAVWIAAPAILSLLTDSLPWLSGWLSQGFAPPVPWATFYFLGVASAEFYTRKGNQDTRKLLLQQLGLGFMSAVPIALMLGTIYKPLSWKHWDGVNLSSLLLFAGVFWFVLALFGYFFDYRPISGKWVETLIGFGNRALTIYYLQFIAVVGAATSLSMIYGAKPSLPWPAFLPFTFLLVFILDVAINRVWAAYRYAGTLEWFLGKIVGR